MIGKVDELNWTQFILHPVPQIFLFAILFIRISMSNVAAVMKASELYAPERISDK